MKYYKIRDTGLERKDVEGPLEVGMVYVEDCFIPMLTRVSIALKALNKELCR